MTTSRSKTKKTSTKPSAPQPNGANGNTDWGFVERILTTPAARTVYLWGRPGLGKTYAAIYLGRVEDGVYCITLTEDTCAAELRGHFVPKGNQMVWHDGPFVTAMRQGARLVVNEITHAPPEVHTLLHPVLESRRTAEITLPTNEIIRPAPGFHVVAADNGSPKELPFALQDRFDCDLEITEPHPEAYERLDPRLQKAARHALVLEDDRHVSLRRWLTVQRFLDDGFNLEDACRASFGRERGAQIYDAILVRCSHD
jgi:MoxR-like ATPase